MDVQKEKFQEEGEAGVSEFRDRKDVRKEYERKVCEILRKARMAVKEETKC